MSTFTVPTHAEILAAVAGIAERVAANAAASERARRLEPDSVDAMAEAGLWRVLTPRTYGGWEAGLRAQVDSTALLARADPAAGWVQMVCNAHAWAVGSFPVAGQDEVFATGPDVRVPGTLAAQGKARRVDGGWVLDGRWQFASGVDHGDWLLVGAVADRLPESPERGLHVVVPKADVVVDDTWHTLGLRGTGSKDLVAAEAFVPAHRALPTRLLFDGRSPHGERHATHLNRLPVLVCLSVQLAGAVVGIAERALRLHVERTRSRRNAYTGRSKAEDAGTQVRIAESTAELTTARLLAQSAADAGDELVRRGEWATTEQRAELKWHAAYVVELCRRATDRVFAASGAHAIYDDSALQGPYRDVNTACHHATVDFDGTAEMFGRVRLGLEPGTPLV